MKHFFDCLDLLEGCAPDQRAAYIEQLIRHTDDTAKLATWLGWLSGTAYPLHMKPQQIDAMMAPHLDSALLAISERYAGDRLEALALQWQTVAAIRTNQDLLQQLAPLTPTARYWLLRMVARRAIPQVLPRDIILALARAFKRPANQIAPHWLGPEKSALIDDLRCGNALPAPSPTSFRLPHPVTTGTPPQGVEQDNVHGVKVILTDNQCWTARGEPICALGPLPSGMTIEAVVQLAGRNPGHIIRRALKRKTGPDGPFRVIVTDVLTVRGLDVSTRPVVSRCALMDQLDWPEGFVPITHFPPRRGMDAIIKPHQAAYGDAHHPWVRRQPAKKMLTLAVLTWQALPTGVTLSVGCQMEDGGTAPVGTVRVTDKAVIAAIKALPTVGKYGPVRELAPGAQCAHILATDLYSNPRKKSGCQLKDEEWAGLTDDAALTLRQMHDAFSEAFMA